MGLQIKKMEMVRYRDIEKLIYLFYMRSFKIMNIIHLFIYIFAGILGYYLIIFCHIFYANKD